VRDNLTRPSSGEGLETGRTLVQAPRQSFTRQICQSQPVKMTWRPLRVLAATMIYLRGLVKREHIGDVDLLPRDGDFLDQALGDGLAVREREAVQVLAQELAKALSIVEDVLPADRLLVPLCSVVQLVVKVV
jgi:hypothetical protein